MVLRGWFRQIAKSDGVDAEPRAGKLAVICGRITRRRFVMGARLLSAAERFSGAALPIIGASQSDRVGDAFGDAGKMRKRGRRVVQEAQSDPAGGELLLGAIVLVDWRGGAIGDRVGRL